MVLRPVTRYSFQREENLDTGRQEETGVNKSTTKRAVYMNSAGNLCSKYRKGNMNKYKVMRRWSRFPRDAVGVPSISIDVQRKCSKSGWMGL